MKSTWTKERRGYSMKVFVAGHKGLAGSALHRILIAKGYSVVTASRTELDLRDSGKVDAFIADHKPEWVFIAAAVVGGIHANCTYPTSFLLDNLKIQNNLIESSHRHKVNKLLFLASNCMYPKLAPQPLKEEFLLTGAFEPTNEAYAIAKVAGAKLCDAYHKEFGDSFMTVVPTTLYGPNDNYHLENAHVLPMLMRRFHEAKERGDREVILWGSGHPTREFMHSDDLAKACLLIMERYNASDIGELLNIGSGQEISIRDLALALKEVIGLDAALVMDPTKPDGAPRKYLDSSRIFSLGWKPETDFLTGLRSTYEDFLSNPHTRK
jgi:GDP-L-fucose synthase